MIEVQSSTSTKVARIKEFLDTEHVPDLTKEDIEAIEEAGSKLHQRIYMRHVYKDQGQVAPKLCIQEVAGLQNKINTIFSDALA